MTQGSMGVCVCVLKQNPNGYQGCTVLIPHQRVALGRNSQAPLEIWIWPWGRYLETPPLVPQTSGPSATSTTDVGPDTVT